MVPLGLPGDSPHSTRNLSLAYPFAVGPATITLQGSVFNVLNRQGVVDVDNNWQISPGVNYPPRRGPTSISSSTPPARRAGPAADKCGGRTTPATARRSAARIRLFRVAAQVSFWFRRLFGGGLHCSAPGTGSVRISASGKLWPYQSALLALALGFAHRRVLPDLFRMQGAVSTRRLRMRCRRSRRWTSQSGTGNGKGTRGAAAKDSSSTAARAGCAPARGRREKAFEEYLALSPTQYWIPPATRARCSQLSRTRRRRSPRSGDQLGRRPSHSPPSARFRGRICARVEKPGEG